MSDLISFYSYPLKSAENLRFSDDLGGKSKLICSNSLNVRRKMLIPYPTFLYCSGLSSIWTFSESCYQFSLTFLLAKKGMLFFIEQYLIFIVVIEMVFVVILEMFFCEDKCDLGIYPSSKVSGENLFISLISSSICCCHCL